ncbi:hypothetical protein H6G03_07550 [Planktothrix sp. FACHB-1375]|uniref:Uncharacterized protein n=2 Tax=Cyanophyceae TaxID=3028117 RepID=A0A926VC46_9CYAN|nr:hypothetical protein [Aerosakkonema funiforme FACHB-1375]
MSIIRLLSESRGIKVHAIRAVFIEGKNIFTNSAIFNRAHIQISILDTYLIQESYLVEEKQE